MNQKKGITVMTLGLIIGIILFVAAIIFIMLFYEGDLFQAILGGTQSQFPGFESGGSGGGGASGEF